MARPAGEDRALASGVIIFVAMLIVAGLLYIAFNVVAEDIFTAASGYTTTTNAQDHIDLMEQFWGGILVFMVFLSGMFVIARAVIESRRGGF